MAGTTVAKSSTVLKDFNDPKQRTAFLEQLAAFSGTNFVADSGVTYHKEPPTKISIPEGMTPAKASKVLAGVAAALEEPKNITRTFKYRPWDGAAAVVRVMQKFFGTTGRGVPIPTMFGAIPPRIMSIEVGYGEHADVPWGRLDFAPFDGWMQLGVDVHKDYGQLFELTFYVPKKHEAAVNGFFNLVENELRENSIYKGKAIVGVEQPTFLPVTVEETIVYTDEVMDSLEMCLWGVIRNRQLLKSDRRKTNKRVLLYGPYGTGKSECGRHTAKIAVDNGVTFIQHFSGEGGLDELRQAAMTARLYAPSVLFIEDVDLYAKVGTGNSDMEQAAQSKLLELFDGITAKDDGVIIVMTSNKAADFSKGMLRAGRVDRMIEIGPLDRAATEKMIRRVIGEDRIDPKTDFDAVWEAMTGFEPAFVRTTFDQAAEAALIRNANRLRSEGFPEAQIGREAKKFVLGTSDFVTAANLLRPQHDLHASKSDSPERGTTFEAVMEQTMSDYFNRRLIKPTGWDDDMDAVRYEVVEKKA